MPERTKLAILLTAMILWLGGCTAAELARQGDADLLADRPHDAVRHFQEAAAYDPNLLRNANFTAGLSRAQWLAAFDDGQQYVKQRRWSDAVDKFNWCLGRQPDSQRARDALADARRRAAVWFHEQALKHADNGELNEAIESLHRALEFDPDNADVKDALQTIAQRKNDQLAAADAVFQQALALAPQKDWARALDGFNETIRLDQNHIRARVERHRAQTQLADSRQAHEHAVQMMAQKRLFKTVDDLKHALDVWPFNDEAAALLAEARGTVNKVDSLHQQAVAHVSKKEWDPAIAALNQALALFPYHQPSTELLRQTKLDAAADYVAHGRQWLADGKLEPAREAFNKALTYAPDLPDAVGGLADVSFAYGQLVEADNLPGSALLYYMDAADLVDDTRYADKVQQMRALILKRAAFSVALGAVDEQGQAGADSSRMAQVMSALAGRKKPAFLTFVDAQDQPKYAVVALLDPIDVHEVHERTESHTHIYTTTRRVPNPDIPRLRSRLLAAEHDLAYLRSAAHQRCSVCGGSGHVLCASCGGRGRITCPDCGGRGRFVRRPGGPARTCSRCGGVGSIACPHCHGHPLLTCSRCGGSGFFSRVSLADVRRKESEVSYMQRELAFAPDYVAESYDAGWPYQVAYYAKLGALTMSVRISDPASGATQRSFTVRKSYRQSDATILNANPSLGLGQDPLDLPADATVRASLIDAAADTAAGAVVDAVVRLRAAGYLDDAQRLDQAKDPANAIESRLRAALVLEPVDAKASQKLIADLRSGQK